MNRKKLVDALKAVGFGLAFFGYAGILLVDYYWHKNKSETDTRARLILDNAATKREDLVSAEFRES